MAGDLDSKSVIPVARSRLQLVKMCDRLAEQSQSLDVTDHLGSIFEVLQVYDVREYARWAWSDTSAYTSFRGMSHEQLGDAALHVPRPLRERQSGERFEESPCRWSGLHK